MPPLLPSEIARIVYGQLIRCDCSSIAERFLNESPHLEECREFVDRMGKPSFIAKAYGLSLQQILERYLEMWHLILERTNDITPDTREKFADPVDALKFLLSAYDQTASQLGEVRSFSDEVKENSIHDNGAASSNFSSRASPTATTEDADQAFQNESTHRSDASEGNGARVAIGEHVTTRRDCSPPKLKRPNSYLHELYASTEIAENNGAGSKKKLKVLKPRQPTFNRSSTTATATATATATCSSAPRKAASNPNLSEDKFRFEDNSSYNGEACVHSEENFAITVSPTDKSSSASASEHTKRRNMQLRSSSKVPDRIAQQTDAISKNVVKASKKRKYASSPEGESALTKQSKLCKSANEKENDTRVDYTKIPQLLIEDPKLPELIAENINRKILESPQKKMDTLTEDLDEMFKSIAEKTLGDDLMDGFIQELLQRQNSGQGKHSPLTDVSLLDDNPYEANINCVDNTGGDGISGNVDVVDERPLPQCAEKSEETLAASTDYSRLHEDMNEFVQFNKPKGGDIVSGGDQSDIIVLEMPETDQYSSNFVADDHIRSAAHSNFVFCSSTDESLATNGKDIMAACTESNDAVINWNVPTTSSMIVTAAAPTDPNTKLQICGPVASPTKLTKRNYRPIAPKPNSAVSKAGSSGVVTRHETTWHSNKSKSSKRTKK